MDQPEIRGYEKRNHEGVCALWADVFGYSLPHNHPEITLRLKEEFQSELFFVAERDGSIVGTIMAGYDGHRGWIYSLAVDPAVRRQGLGAALVHHAEAKLAALGCIKVNLQIYIANQDVIEFYRKLGYSVEDRISMGKRL